VCVNLTNLGNDSIRDEMRILLNGAFGPATFRCGNCSLFLCPKKAMLRSLAIGSSWTYAPKSHLAVPLTAQNNPYAPQMDLNGGIKMHAFPLQK